VLTCKESGRWLTQSSFIRERVSKPDMNKAVDRIEIEGREVASVVVWQQ